MQRPMEKNDKNIYQEEQNDNELVRRIAEQKYEFGFTTDVHTEIIKRGGVYVVKTEATPHAESPLSIERIQLDYSLQSSFQTL